MGIAELDEPGARRLLEEGVLARLAYVGRDEGPVVVPVGFLWTGTAIVVCTATTAPKAEAIRNHARVAIEIEGGNGAEELLLIRGDATVDVVDGVADEYLAMSRKSMSGDEADAFEQQVRAVYPQMARIAVTPSWARYYNFPAGRLPPFLQALVDAASS